MNKEYARFQKKGIDPDIVSKNDFMFGSTVATGEFAWAPSSDADVLGKKDQNEDDIISLNDSADDPLQKSMDRFLQEDDIISDDNSNIGKKRKTRKRNIESGQGTSTNAKDKGKKQRMSGASKLRSDISKLVETVEKRSGISEVGYTIKEIMDDLHAIPDVPKNTELYYFAVTMFEQKAKRELWKHLETTEAKVGWLKYQKEQQDMRNSKY